DRRGYVDVRRHGGAVASSVMVPKPYGLWGLSGADLTSLPGFRDPARDKADARRLLTEAGFGPNKPLRLEMATRSWALQTDLAIFVQDQLRHVRIQTTPKPMEPAVRYP